jgi:hypothetical protein
MYLQEQAMKLPSCPRSHFQDTEDKEDKWKVTSQKVTETD